MSSSSNTSEEGRMVTIQDVNQRGHLDKKEKTPAIDTSTCFPTDETPTPTKILRMADMDLFHDLKENPFDAHFRKATEAVKQGADNLSASMTATDISCQGSGALGDDTLNTPKIYCGGDSTPQPFSGMASHAVVSSRPVILKVHSHTGRSAGSSIPVASVQPLLTSFKPIAPSPTLIPPASSGTDNAMLLLKFPSGETIKLSNLPFEKANSTLATTNTAVQEETRLRLKRTLSDQKRNEFPNIIRNRHPESLTIMHRQPDSLTEGQNEEFVEDILGKVELKERNRMSAQRSRQKKRQQSETLAKTCLNFQKENSALNRENKVLREELAALRNLLAQHVDCNVTKERAQQKVQQPQIEPHTVMETQKQHAGLNNSYLIENGKKLIKDDAKIPVESTCLPLVIAEKHNIIHLPVVEGSSSTRNLSTSFATRDLSTISTAKDLLTTPSTRDLSTKSSNFTAIVPLPPQTFPEDLRVDTRLNKYEETQNNVFLEKSTKLVSLKSRTGAQMSTYIIENMDSGSDLDRGKILSQAVEVPLELIRNNSVENKRRAIPTVSGEPDESQMNNPTPVSLGIKQTLARHCHKKSETKEKKVVVAKRLKDKLQVLKQKMAEDNNFSLTLGNHEGN